MPLTRRQIYRRRRIAVFGGAALVLGTAFYLPFTLLAPLHPVSAVESSHEVLAAGAPAIDFPPYGAAGLGAVGYEGVLASAGTPAALPIASISKVITALVVLDAHPLAVADPGPTITFTQQDEAFYAEQVANDGIVEAATAGTAISQRNMMDAMLMASANNYAQSLATWAFGSEAAYTDAARAWLAAHNLTQTVMLDASGMNPGNVSTVPDLINIAKLAIADPVVSAIVATPTITIPGIGVVDNRNALLGIDGIDGIKTGTLDEAGSCLLFSLDFAVADQTVTLVGVVLGGPDHDTINAAIRSLIGQAEAGFQQVTLTSTGDQYGVFDTAWGDEASAVPSEAVTAVVWTGAPIDSSVQLDAVTTAAQGTDVGDLRFTVGDMQYTVDLVLDRTLADPGPWWRLTHPSLLF